MILARFQGALHFSCRLQRRCCEFPCHRLVALRQATSDRPYGCCDSSYVLFTTCRRDECGQPWMGVAVERIWTFRIGQLKAHSGLAEDSIVSFSSANLNPYSKNHRLTLHGSSGLRLLKLPQNSMIEKTGNLSRRVTRTKARNTKSI